MGIIKKINSKLGFTLLEVIVVLLLISLVLPVLFNLLFLDMRARQKVYIIEKVKSNGDNALSTMEFLIQRRAQKIIAEEDQDISFCESFSEGLVDLGNKIAFLDENNIVFSFSSNQDTNFNGLTYNKISSSSALTSIDLTDDTVSIENLSFNCIRPSNFSPPIISVSFTVKQVGESVFDENIFSLHYATKIKLRNY